MVSAAPTTVVAVCPKISPDFFRKLDDLSEVRLWFVDYYSKGNMQDEEVSPDMRQEKACEHHIQHDEGQDRVSGGNDNRASCKLI